MTLTGMALVARHSNVPIGADEGLHSNADIQRHHDNSAAQGGSLKMIKLGGMTRTYQASKMCGALGMSINMAGKIAECHVWPPQVCCIWPRPPPM